MSSNAAIALSGQSARVEPYFDAADQAARREARYDLI
jgi:hypothetical protein